jgi:hypothetical protein
MFDLCPLWHTYLLCVLPVYLPCAFMELCMCSLGNILSSVVCVSVYAFILMYKLLIVKVVLFYRFHSFSRIFTQLYSCVHCHRSLLLAFANIWPNPELLPSQWTLGFPLPHFYLSLVLQQCSLQTSAGVPGNADSVFPHIASQRGQMHSHTRGHLCQRTLS